MYIKVSLIHTGFKGVPFIMDEAETEFIEQPEHPESWEDLLDDSKSSPKIVKIYGISDIHSEFFVEKTDKLMSLLPKVSAKYCILAGDIGCVTLQPGLLRKVFKFFVERHEYVIFVPGNHEYYGGRYKIEDINQTLAKICLKEKVYLLNRDTIVLDNVLFIGAILWSAIDDAGFKGINDSHHVFAHKVEYLDAFIEDYRFLKEELQKSLDYDMPVVVITHHLPSKRLIHPRYRDSDINSAFYTNLTDILPMHKVKYWFCGHTHEMSRVKILDTMFICNPMGYPDEIRYTKTSEETYNIVKN